MGLDSTLHHHCITGLYLIDPRYFLQIGLFYTSDKLSYKFDAVLVQKYTVFNTKKFEFSMRINLSTLLFLVPREYISKHQTSWSRFCLIFMQFGGYFYLFGSGYDIGHICVADLVVYCYRRTHFQPNFLKFRNNYFFRCKISPFKFGASQFKCYNFQK